MLRYLVLATAIVLGLGVSIAGWVNRDALRIKIASVYASAKPKAEPTNPPASGDGRPLRGNAPWALSALPECFVQLSQTTGQAAYVRMHLPAGAVAVTPPATLRAGDCTIELRGDEISVRRGTDRLTIPPVVRLYRAPGKLALLREGQSGNDLRVYEPLPY
jgi:hypothetical protein